MSAAVFQTGIIDVGAHAVRMEIFEVDSSGKYSLWESLTRASRLGTDVFRTGFVSPESVDALAAVMGDYASRLKEYGITEIRAFATSAIREAGNRDLVTDRIRHDSGINLEIMDSAIETELIYSSMKKQLPSLAFSDSAPVIAVVIGSGSLFVILIRNGELKFCEEIPLGTDRFSGVFGSSKVTPDQFLEELRSLDIPQRLAESAGFEPEEPVHFITMGAAPRLAVGKANSNIVISTEKALELISGFRETPVPELTAALGASADDGAAGIGAAVILECFLRIFKCTDFSCLSISTREAVVEDMVRKVIAPGSEPFRNDLRSLCHAIGHKYGFDADHAETVADTALQIFRTLNSVLNLPDRAEMLLETASLLHDIGRFVDTRDHNLHSCYLISATQLPGLSAAEHRIVALTAGAHRGDAGAFLAEAENLLPEHRVLVFKLSAILRAADALDCAREGKFRNLTINRNGLLMEFRGSGRDFHSEIRELELKGDLFPRVFGIKVRILEG